MGINGKPTTTKTSVDITTRRIPLTAALTTVKVEGLLDEHSPATIERLENYLSDTLCNNIRPLQLTRELIQVDAPLSSEGDGSLLLVTIQNLPPRSMRNPHITQLIHFYVLDAMKIFAYHCLRRTRPAKIVIGIAVEQEDHQLFDVHLSALDSSTTDHPPDHPPDQQ